MNSVLRWCLVLASALLIGPTASFLWLALRDSDGGHAVSVFLNTDPARAAMGLVVLFAAAWAVGILGARYFTLSTGFLSSGIVLAWGAWRMGTLEDIVRQRQASPGAVLALEGLVVMGLTAALAYVMCRVSRAHQPAALVKLAAPRVQVDAVDKFPAFVSVADGGTRTPTLAAMGASIVAAGVIGWLVAVNVSHGQTFFAALVAGVFAGLATQSVATGMRAIASPAVTIAGLVLLGVVGPVIGPMLAGTKIVPLVYANQFFPLSRIMPLDWAAGSLVGVLTGFSWAGSMIDVRAMEEQQGPSDPAPSSAMSHARA